VEKASKGLWISPNPVRQGENIQIQTRNEIILMQLYSIDGKLIQTNNATKTLTTNTLQQGMYMLTIQTNDKEIHNRKIIIY
jgi:hypothetical protein